MLSYISNEYLPYVDAGISLLLIVAIIILSIKQKLSTKVVITTSIAFALFVVSGIFNLPIIRGVAIVFVALCTVYASVLLTKPEKELELRRNKKVSKKENSLTINETDELFENLKKAIEALSMTQTGALITIERSDDLTPFIQKSGTKVNAPLTPEIIGTIFYKGTPLHDGATIVRGNMIMSSAVFYQPTQKPLNGKYGSRHRAAIGISEICDALTIVVSEETGKVSFAYKGELISVPVANFTEKLKEYYFINK